MTLANAALIIIYTALLYIEIIPLLQSHHILLMAGRGRGRGNKSHKKPAKKSSSRKKPPPNPTPPHLPSDDASSHHDEEWDISSSPAPVMSPSASQTSRPSSPVCSIPGDGKGPGEGPV